MFLVGVWIFIFIFIYTYIYLLTFARVDYRLCSYQLVAALLFIARSCSSLARFLLPLLTHTSPRSPFTRTRTHPG